MEIVLKIREYIVKYIKILEPLLLPLLKFLLGCYVFNKILTIGQVNDIVAPFMTIFTGRTMIIILGLTFTFLPYSLSWLLMILIITLQYSAHIEMAVVIFFLLTLILFFYARMAVKESIFILLIILAFYFRVPYLVLLLAGLYSSFTVIIPIAIGVFIYEYIPIIQRMVETTQTAGLNIQEMPGTFTAVYTSLASNLTANQSWIFTAFIFAMVIIIVHVVSRLSIDYAKEIAILLGCVLNIFGFILANIVVHENISIGSIFLYTLLCGLIAGIIRLFDGVLDYRRGENVQFQDEQYFYFVKVVPKILSSDIKSNEKDEKPQEAPADDAPPPRRPRTRTPLVEPEATEQSDTPVRRPRMRRRNIDENGNERPRPERQPATENDEIKRPERPRNPENQERARIGQDGEVREGRRRPAANPDRPARPRRPRPEPEPQTLDEGLGE